MLEIITKPLFQAKKKHGNCNSMASAWQLSHNLLIGNSFSCTARYVCKIFQLNGNSIAAASQLHSRPFGHQQPRTFSQRASDPNCVAVGGGDHCEGRGKRDPT